MNKKYCVEEKKLSMFKQSGCVQKKDRYKIIDC